MLSFKKWLSKQVVIGSDVTYNTANDIIADNNFPESVCKFVMLDYLEKMPMIIQLLFLMIFTEIILNTSLRTPTLWINKQHNCSRWISFIHILCFV